MSNMAPKLVAAVKARRWQDAYNECNGQSMPAMLDGLDEIGTQALRDMRAQMAIYAVWGGPNMPRIQFAMDVVATRKLPKAPDGLPNDQVRDAQLYLAGHRPGTGKPAGVARKLRIALFWTRNAAGETQSSALVQRARELLRDNQTGLELDVASYHGILDFPGEILIDDEFDEVMALAKQAPYYAADRLCVIFFSVSPPACNPRAMSCPKPPFGTTPKDGFGRRFVFINVARAATDRATLLHEMGHAAGIESKDADNAIRDLTDVMSYGTNRTKIGENQLQHFKSRSLFFAR